jgi:uncharacterized protein (DUF849 family)
MGDLVMSYLKELGKDKDFPISFCPTGMVSKKDDNPAVPTSPKEIIESVKQARQMGITSVHIHARREDETPAWEKNYYEKIIAGIREFDQDLVLCVTTSGRDISEFAKRSAVLELDGECKPDMASLTLSSLNFGRQSSINSPEIIQQLASKMVDMNIKPEIEIFDLGMINYLKYLHRKGILNPPFIINILLGNIATLQVGFSELGLAIDRLPESSTFLVAGIGEGQLKANVMGLLSGGGVRIGLEDNIYFDEDRKILATNSMLLERVLSIGELLGRKPMPSSRFREKYIKL